MANIERAKADMAASESELKNSKTKISFDIWVVLGTAMKKSPSTNKSLSNSKHPYK